MCDLPRNIPVPCFLTSRELFSSQLSSILNYAVVSLSIERLTIFPVAVSTPSYYTSSGDFYDAPYNEGSSTSGGGECLPPTFYGPRFLTPTPPQFSSSVAADSKCHFSCLLGVSIRPSIRPSLARVASGSYIGFYPRARSGRLLEIPTTLCAKVVASATRPPQGIGSLRSTFPRNHVFPDAYAT